MVDADGDATRVRWTYVFTLTTPLVWPLAAPLLSSPFDFLVSAVTAGACVALAFFAVEAWRLHAAFIDATRASR